MPRVPVDPQQQSLHRTLRVNTGSSVRSASSAATPATSSAKKQQSGGEEELAYVSAVAIRYLPSGRPIGQQGPPSRAAYNPRGARQRDAQEVRMTRFDRITSVPTILNG